MLLPLSSRLVLLVMSVTLTSPVPDRPQSPPPGEESASWYPSLVALLKRLTLPAADSAGLDTGSDF
jgi:hypothetical protein